MVLCRLLGLLYQALIEPVRGALPPAARDAAEGEAAGSQLLIVPDLSLFAIPWAALWDGGAGPSFDQFDLVTDSSSDQFVLGPI